MQYCFIWPLLFFKGPHLTMFNTLSIMRYIRQRLRKVVRRYRGFGRNSTKPCIHTQQGPIYYKDPILSKRTKAKTLINIINLLYHIRYYIHMVETKKNQPCRTYVPDIMEFKIKS